MLVSFSEGGNAADCIYVFVIYFCFQVNFLIDHHCKTESEFLMSQNSHIFFDVYAGCYSNI